MTDVTTLTYAYDATTLEYTAEVTQIEASGLGPPGPSSDAGDVQALIDTAIASLTTGAPLTLDTLNELAAAIGDDPDFVGTLTTAFATKISNSLLNANTLVKADDDDTPTALTIPEQALVGRITGGVIAALSAAQVKTLLALNNVDNTSDVGKPVSTAQATADTAIGTAAASDATSKVSTHAALASGVHGITSAAATVLDDTTTAAMLTTLGAQPVDTDLTTIAGLTATTDNMIQSVGSAWASRTPAQVKTALALTPGTDVQAYDADLATIAGLTATTDNMIQSVGSAWASRTPAQVKTALALTIGTNVQAWSAVLDALAAQTDLAVVDGGTGASTAAGAAANLAVLPSVGWTPEASLPTYSSGTGTNVVVFTATTDATTRMSVGWKIRFTQSTVKYGIITALTATSITAYLGTDYTTTTGNPTTFDVSPSRAPLGFPMSPAKWTVTVTDTGNAAKSSPVSGTWYGDTGLSATGPHIDVPIGVWRVWAKAHIVASSTPTGTGTPSLSYQFITMSTGTTTESDPASTTGVSLSTTVTATITSEANGLQGILSTAPIVVTCAASTPYYLNTKTGSSLTAAIALRGDVNTTRLFAECAYL